MATPLAGGGPSGYAVLMGDGEESADRQDRRRRARLATPLLVVLGLSVAACVFYVLEIVDLTAPDMSSDLPAEPVQLLLLGLTVVAALVGLAAVAGTLVIFAAGDEGERRIPLAALATVSGVLSAMLLIPPVAYSVVFFVNDFDDPAFWEMGRFALVTTSLGVVGLAAAAYEWWLVTVTDAGPRGAPEDHAGP